MKKTTYILIALAVAGLIFAFVFPMALIRSSKISEFSFMMNADSLQKEIKMQNFSNLRIVHSETDLKTDMSHLVSVILQVEEADSAASAPTLSIPEKASEWISVDEAADTTTLSLTLSEEAIKELQEHPLMDISLPMTLRIPGNTLRSIACTARTNIAIRGMQCDSLTVSDAYMISLDTCRISTLTTDITDQHNTYYFHMNLNLTNSVIDNANLKATDSCDLNGNGSSEIRTLTVTPKESTRGTLSLDAISVDNVQFTPTESGSVSIIYSASAINSLAAAGRRVE